VREPCCNAVREPRHEAVHDVAAQLPVAAASVRGSGGQRRSTSAQRGSCANALRSSLSIWTWRVGNQRHAPAASCVLQRRVPFDAVQQHTCDFGLWYALTTYYILQATRSRCLSTGGSQPAGAPTPPRRHKHPKQSTGRASPPCGRAPAPSRRAAVFVLVSGIRLSRSRRAALRRSANGQRPVRLSAVPVVA